MTPNDDGADSLISVVVTVHNGAAFLREALDSLRGQSDHYFEIVVVNDGSTDGTAAILADERDARTRVFTRDRADRAAALAEAVAQARGSLIAILDADDVAMSNRLATQRAFLARNPDVALVGSGAIEFDDRREWRRHTVTGCSTVRRALGMYNPFYHSSVMFRRAAYDDVGGYRDDGGWGHDKDLLIRLASRYPVDIIADPLIKYRRHAAQISGDPARESFRRRKSAALQLRAARVLGLPAPYWIVPLAAWVYAYMPAWLRPQRLKDAAKRALLGMFRARAEAHGGRGR